MIPDEVKARFEAADGGRKGKIWAGANQTYRKILNGEAKVVLIADNTKPPEIVLPLVNEIKNKKIEMHYGTKEEIGRLAKCPRHAAAACIV